MSMTPQETSVNTLKYYLFFQNFEAIDIKVFFLTIPLGRFKECFIGDLDDLKFKCIRNLIMFF